MKKKKKKRIEIYRNNFQTPLTYLSCSSLWTLMMSGSLSELAATIVTGISIGSFEEHARRFAGRVLYWGLAFLFFFFLLFFSFLFFSFLFFSFFFFLFSSLPSLLF